MIIYKAIMALLVPVLLLRRLWRGEARADLAQRLGRGTAHPVDLWLHGASLGELTSARWVITGLLAARPGLRIVVTSNTLTGRQMVEDWGLERVFARLAPLDTGLALGAFRQGWQPKALISLEAEYWPLRFTCGLPVLLLGARMSARSFRRWQKRAGLATAMLSGVRLASAQDARSRTHLAALGLPAGAVLPDLDLKAQAVAHLPLPVTLARADRANCLLAASTHEGEEAIILRAFTRQSQFTHLILAPRHPARAPEIVALLQSMGLSHGRRSLGAEPGDAAIYLADTLGEMDLWYARAGAVVIGGSFTDRGGHTPWEPIRWRAALLHGPSTHNFTAAFAKLDATVGALPVSAENLHSALATLSLDNQDKMAGRALTALQAQGDITSILTQILSVCEV